MPPPNPVYDLERGGVGWTKERRPDGEKEGGRMEKRKKAGWRKEKRSDGEKVDK